VDDLPVTGLRREFDAMVLCGGARWARDLQIPGRETCQEEPAVKKVSPADDRASPSENACRSTPS
jgi:NADPH-dependent glutamate synthase beta subunit-like oxidoreductase